MTKLSMYQRNIIPCLQRQYDISEYKPSNGNEMVRIGYYSN